MADFGFHDIITVGMFYPSKSQWVSIDKLYLEIFRLIQQLTEVSQHANNMTALSGERDCMIRQDSKQNQS